MFRSTLPRGERRAARPAAWRSSTGFDPRSRAGSDQVDDHEPAVTVVSIHAPARGATWPSIVLIGSQLFRSTLPRGERLWSRMKLVSWTKFRSTLPRGERPPAGWATISRTCFDPRSRAGSDHALPTATPFGTRFDPRSRAGSDCRTSTACWRHRCFDPRSRAGSDSSSCTGACGTGCFDPRSRAGSDQVEARWRDQLRVSIHAPARGATLAVSAWLDGDGFRSTLPRGERHLYYTTAASIRRFRSTLPRGERRGE